MTVSRGVRGSTLGLWSIVYLFHHQGCPPGRVFGLRDGVRAAHHQEVDGQQGRYQTDPGSQLMCAAKELSAWRKNWDLEELIRFGTDKGLTWNFIMADSQHQNGAAESLIKVVKGITKSLMRVVGDPKLSLNELNTLLAECANLANERPIGLKPNIHTDPEYLSPNSLQFGRSSSRISSGPFIYK